MAENLTLDGAPYQSNTQVTVLDGYTIGDTSGISGVVGGVTVSGWNLIRPITTGGKTYYVVDVNGDGVITTSDRLTHDQLDALFNGGADTTSALRTNSSATHSLLPGYDVLLPTQAELMDLWTASGVLPADWGTANNTWSADVGTTASGFHKGLNVSTGTAFSNSIDTNLNYAVFQIL